MRAHIPRAPLLRLPVSRPRCGSLSRAPAAASSPPRCGSQTCTESEFVRSSVYAVVYAETGAQAGDLTEWEAVHKPPFRQVDLYTTSHTGSYYVPISCEPLQMGAMHGCQDRARHRADRTHRKPPPPRRSDDSARDEAKEAIRSAHVSPLHGLNRAKENPQRGMSTSLLRHRHASIRLTTRETNIGSARLPVP